MDFSLRYAATLRSPREPLGLRPDPGTMGDRILVLLVFVLSVMYLFTTSRLRVVEIGDPIGIKMYPALVGIAAIVTGLLLVGEIVRSRRFIAAPANDTAAGNTIRAWCWRSWVGYWLTPSSSVLLAI